MEVNKIERVSITDEVVRQIEANINAGVLAVGSKLPTESELCSQFGVGRSTVREAIKILAAKGTITFITGKGAFINDVEKFSFETISQWFTSKHTELGELLEVRLAIEPLTVRLAIENAPKKSIQKIVDIEDEFVKASSKLDIVALAKLDEAFHSAIIEASGNGLLVKIGKLINQPMMEFRLRSFAVQNNIGHAEKAHSEIITALLNRNVSDGVEAMVNHLNSTRQDMEMVVNKKET